MKAGPCCPDEGAPRRFVRRLSGAVVSILPGAALTLLPKCPLCLAAWLTVATGVGVSAAAAARVREWIVVLWLAIAAVAAAQFILRRARRSGPGGLNSGED